MSVPSSLTRTAVIGNGIIGHGVAQVFAMAGKEVMLIGRSADSLARALDNIRDGLKLFADNGLITAGEATAALARVKTSTSLDDAAGSQLVIEAVPEDMALKVDIFGRLDSICPVPAVLGTSSGHPASEVVAKVNHRARVIATHFWYPPTLLPLVEVCSGPETSREVRDWTCAVLKEAGKEPVVIDKEIDGFIGNRIQFAILREAWSLWASGAASAEAIDAVVRNSIGRRLAITGPIESADVGGLDTMHAFASFLLPSLDAGKVPAAKVGEVVKAGGRGLANGRGIYDWSKRDGNALLAERKAELIRWLKVDKARRGG
jgi:3-hydroxybutyryl-CoA dehydrogenase